MSINIDDQVSLFYVKMNQISSKLTFLSVALYCSIPISFLVGMAIMFCIMRCTNRRTFRKLKAEVKELKKQNELISRKKKRRFPFSNLLSPELNQGSNDVSIADLNSSSNSIPAIESEIDDNNNLESAAAKYKITAQSPNKHESSSKCIVGNEEEKAEAD